MKLANIIGKLKSAHGDLVDGDPAAAQRKLWKAVGHLSQLDDQTAHHEGVVKLANELAADLHDNECGSRCAPLCKKATRILGDPNAR